MKTRPVLRAAFVTIALLAARLAWATSPLPETGGQTSSLLPFSRQPAPVAPSDAAGAATNALMVPTQTSTRTLPRPAGSMLTLKDAISIALKYHPKVAEAAAETGAAREQVGEARSYLGPQLFGVSEYLRSTTNGIGNTSYYNPDGILPRITGQNHDLPSGDTSQSWGTSNDYTGGLGLSQYLFDFGRRYGFVRERQLEASAARASQNMVDLQVTFEVSQRYFNLLEAQRLVHVYEKAVEQRKFHLHEAQVRAQTGLRPELDVYLTEAEVQRAQLHLVDARNSEADARVGFDNALGLGGDEPNYQLADVTSYTPIKNSLQPLIAKALRHRPDIQALADQARAMGAQVTEYKSDYFPTVNAVAGYSAMGTGLPTENNFNAGIVITWPIFNSFLTSHEVGEAELRQRALEEQIEDLRQRIILQVKTALLDWQASMQRIQRAERTLDASRAELQLSEGRYKNGLADIVELEDAQRNYTADDASYADTLYRFYIAKAALDLAVGSPTSGV